jgi:hypothetical protein
MANLFDTTICSWFVRLTRFGSTHLVRGQEAPASCGINCVMMAVCRMNKWKLIADGNNVEQLVYPKYDASYVGTSYTYTGKLAALLNKLGIGEWESVNVGEAGVAQALIDSAAFLQLSSVPVIVHVEWNNHNGHFVLVDYTYNVFGAQYATVCDPWDSHVHVTRLTKGGTTQYDVDSDSVVGWSLDRPTNTYGTTINQGKFSGWIVRCKKVGGWARAGKFFFGTGM